MQLFLAVVNAISVVVLVAVTIWYARSTAHMLAAMQHQSELLILSIEVQALLAEIQAAQTTNVGSESLKRVFELTHRIGEIRSKLPIGPNLATAD